MGIKDLTLQLATSKKYSNKLCNKGENNQLGYNPYTEDQKLQNEVVGETAHYVCMYTKKTCMNANARILN